MDTFAKSIFERARDAVRPAQQLGGVDASAITPTGYTGSIAQSGGDAYKHNRGWVNAALRVIINRTASQAFCLARRTKDGERPVPTSKHLSPVRVNQMTHLARQGDATWFRSKLPLSLKSQAEGLQLIETHPLLDAIRDPNDIMVTWSLMAVTLASLELTGRAFWWVYQEENGKIRIWPLPANWFSPIHEIELYGHWRIKPASGFASLIVPGSQVVYFYLPDPGNPFGSLGTLQAQGSAVATDEAISTAQTRAFANGLYPGLAIVTNRAEQPGGTMMPTSPGAAGGKRVVLTEDQRNAILWHFKKKLGGVYNMDAPFIVDGLIEDIKKITLTNREMDFLNSSKVAKERVTQGFGTNPISMGQVEAASRASSAIADDHLIRNVVNPRMELMGQVISAWMSPIFAQPGEELVGFLEEASSSDADLELARSESAFAGGSITLNEKRAADGYPPIRGGDVLLVDPSKVAVPAVLEGEETKPLDPIWDLPVLPGEEEASSRAKRRRPTTLHKSLDSFQRKALWVKLHSKEERAFASALRRHLDSEVMSIAAAVRKRRSLGDPKDLVASVYDVDEATTELTKAARPHMTSIAKRGATLELELRQPRRSSPHTAKAALLLIYRARKRPPLPEEINNRIDAYTDQILAEGYWSDINKRRREQIANIIGEGAKNDLDPNDVANQIEDAMGGRVSAASARNIARTETTGALNYGGEAVRLKWKREGKLKSKEWVAVRDSATRDSHADADGQRVRPRAKFDVGGERCFYPGDPSLSAEERCNCLLPGAMIEGNYSAAMRSLYSGQAVEIVTRSGRRLALTPNHPVLTQYGWVLAGKLNCGQKILSAYRQLDSTPRLSVPGCDQVNNMPTEIEKVFKAFMLRAVACSGIESVEIKRAQMDDFNGDGSFLNGNIEVVRADGPLPFDSIPSSDQKSSDSVLSFEAPYLTSEARHRSSSLALGRVRPTSLGFPGGTALLEDSRTSILESRPLEFLRFGAASDLNTGNREMSYQSSSANTRIGSELLHRNTGLVFLDELIEVRNFEFRGHVYCLQSSDGLIVSNSIVISNCRCFCNSILFADVDEPDEESQSLEHFASHNGNGKPVIKKAVEINVDAFMRP